jgi:hypothetical protein
VTYKVYVDVKNGRAIAQAKLAYIDWLLPLPLTRVRGLCSTYPLSSHQLFHNPVENYMLSVENGGILGSLPATWFAEKTVVARDLSDWPVKLDVKRSMSHST